MKRIACVFCVILCSIVTAQAEEKEKEKKKEVEKKIKDLDKDGPGTPFWERKRKKKEKSRKTSKSSTDDNADNLKKEVRKAHLQVIKAKKVMLSLKRKAAKILAAADPMDFSPCVTLPEQEGVIEEGVKSSLTIFTGMELKKKKYMGDFGYLMKNDIKGYTLVVSTNLYKLNNVFKDRLFMDMLVYAGKVAFFLKEMHEDGVLVNFAGIKYVYEGEAYIADFTDWVKNPLEKDIKLSTKSRDFMDSVNWTELQMLCVKTGAEKMTAKISLAVLFSDYMENGIEADERYNGVIINFEGHIIKAGLTVIDKDAYIAYIETDEDLELLPNNKRTRYEAAVYFYPFKIKDSGAVNKGEDVRVRGIVSNMSNKRITVTHGWLGK